MQKLFNRKGSPWFFSAIKQSSGWWQWLRHLSGDDAYERYLRHYAETHPGRQPMSRKEYFRCEQERKWSGIGRCC